MRREMPTPSIVVLLGALLLAACAPAPTVPPPVVQAAPAGAALPPGFAELTVFNISGWTLIPSNQDVTDNGHALVSLPRETYKRLFIGSGGHELSLHSRVLKIDAKEGERYRVAAGYHPERSLLVPILLPILGDPVVIQLISEAEARDLAKTMKAQ